MPLKPNKQKDAFSPESLRDAMLTAASQVHASDVHVDPGFEEYGIRFRVDGTLTTWLKRPMEEYDTILSYFKVLSGINITEHNVPQDSHFKWSDPESQSSDSRNSMDIRASFFPVIHGQAIVLRLLNREDFLIDLDKLFQNPRDLKMVKELIHRPYGMVLVSGPANSGKTTTIYSILKELSGEARNIVTLEDPVEYFLPYIRQSQIREEVNYTFAVGLKSILRQDPDITMIGEIRDFETAENALRSSLSGRLFFSTIHANNSVGVITRLIDMQLKKDLVAYALSGVISQRLIRKVCSTCKTPYKPAPEVLGILGLNQDEQFLKGVGCEACAHTGFDDRIRLYEILIIDDRIHRMILLGAPASEIMSYATENGLKTLRQDGVEKIRAGLTTPEEVIASTI